MHASGTSVSRLVGLEEHDSITGIPRMSAIPISVEALDGHHSDHATTKEARSMK